MKTEEDEAFDDLAKKQGDWGGGFPAKRAMAKARIEDDDDIQDYKKPWVGLTDADIENCIHVVEKKGINVFDLVKVIEAKLKEKNV
jgi:hypothetical protein